MAFDGFTTAALVRELNDKLAGGRIYRIVQPESDELLLTIRPMMEKGGGQVRLTLSADPSLPLCYLTKDTRPAPQSAPTFCMLLRKYLQNGRITSVTQPGLERIIRIEIEHLNEMGDLCHHVLVIELMGKHSNIILLTPAAEADRAGIFIDEQSENGSAEGRDIILDSIRHVSQMVSSVREVLPGRPYFIPKTQGKRDPLAETRESFLAALSSCSVPAPRFLVQTYTGFSNVMAEEVTFRTHLGQDRSVSGFTPREQEQFYRVFRLVLEDVSEGRFSPAVYYHLGAADTIAQGEPLEYACLPLTMYRDLPVKRYESVSVLLESYYREKNALTRIRQKSADLRKVVQTILERDIHKYDLQCRQMKDTDKREKYRLYGELLHTYGYSIPAGADRAVLDNYYTNEKVTVPLDPARSAAQNAAHYFERYTKMKRTREELEKITKEVKAQIDQLETIRTSLDLSTTEGDLAQIRDELVKSGFLHRHTAKETKGRAKTPVPLPLHFVSSDGYDIYVGKNNTQNDELTFHKSKPTDIWFHANDIPGSHVILCTGGKPMEQIPDRAFLEAASLAAYYSSARGTGKLEVDYLERRNVKKPGGARPGFVVYYTNYSINVSSDDPGLKPTE